MEGFFIDNQYQIAYGRGGIISGNFTFTTYEILGSLDANNMYQYVTLSQNGETVSFSKNGRFINGLYDEDAGTVVFDETKRLRLSGYGYFYHYNGTAPATNVYKDTCKLYYNGMRLSRLEKTQDDIFDTYLKLFSRI